MRSSACIWAALMEKYEKGGAVRYSKKPSTPSSGRQLVWFDERPGLSPGLLFLSGFPFDTGRVSIGCGVPIGRAFSALLFCDRIPRPSAWAGIDRAFGPEVTAATAVGLLVEAMSGAARMVSAVRSLARGGAGWLQYQLDLTGDLGALMIAEHAERAGELVSDREGFEAQGLAEIA